MSEGGYTCPLLWLGCLPWGSGQCMYGNGAFAARFPPLVAGCCNQEKQIQAGSPSCNSRQSCHGQQRRAPLWLAEPNSVSKKQTEAAQLGTAGRGLGLT